MIAGLNLATKPPLGPFLPQGVSELRDGEAVLLDWVENPLGGLAPGTKLKLTYFNPDVEGDGKKETAELTLRGYIPMTGPAKDRDLTPVIRGVTDERAKMFDWDRPPMLPKEEIQKRVPDNSPRAPVLERRAGYADGLCEPGDGKAILYQPVRCGNLGACRSRRRAIAGRNRGAARPGHRRPSRSSFGGARLRTDPRTPINRQPWRHRFRRPLPRLQLLPDRRGTHARRALVPVIARSPGQGDRLAAGNRV